MVYILRLLASIVQHGLTTVFHFLTINYFAELPPPATGPMKKIVILGGSFAGISTAHRILKQSAKAGPVKITLVSPNTHFYWNVAAPRAILPGQISDEKIFLPIAAGFKQYKNSQYEIITGRAQSLDFETKTVEIIDESGERTLDYDYLVLATGSRTAGDIPFKTLDTTEKTREALHGYQEQARKAKTIVIGGAGPTGVETAGELAFEYGKQKRTILLTSATRVLDSAIPSVSKVASDILHRLAVEVKLSTKVVSSSPISSGQIELTLSSGEKILTDMYIPTYGVLPNSSYIPASYLDDKGFVKVDQQFRVSGQPNVFAIGDVSNLEPPQVMFVDKQSTHLAKNIVLVLGGKQPVEYKLGPKGLGLQIGRKTGTGHLGNFKIPGFLVHMLRKNLFLDKVAPLVDGSAF
ncbi:NAD(P)/FAD-dependent oxidoreductase [Aspergillus melleus]|uniref:NAD(P)/FAD-dependent oxidoreductase n=1 Tax=Aspergillus melleus TaxID=138277 RepID=UPI001E8E3566|nr:uncharacterized protein LDX57_003011 [Aspergillus melleus]KAH8425255.1 hypothetical protein LDX57_003011 [Aspergillus melleus]